ncbi:OSTB protein, partial [Locustella ochotensis]|nr:OSTB protein [Locustella ochotensis]
MKFFWIIPFFLLQDTEAFLIKNVRVKLASLINRNLLLGDCSPESHSQDWSWQDNSLVNCGSQSCLSMVGDGECGKALSASWGLCSPGAPQLWGCALRAVFCLLGETCWATLGVKGKVTSSLKGCSEWLLHPSLSTTAEAEHKYLPTTLATTHMDEHTTANVTLPLGLELEQLEELLWFFRTEDPSSWNYSVLALSLATMILGLVLLAINIVRNRKRKILMNEEASQTAQEADLDAKQALMPVQEYSLAEPPKQEPGPQDQRPGDVMVQWKDGTVTSLYMETSEEAI